MFEIDAELGAEVELDTSTVVCLCNRNFVNFSPREACLNQGREIFRWVETFDFLQLASELIFFRVAIF